MAKITFQFAQEIGLIPDVNRYKTLWKCGPLKRVVEVSEGQYMDRLEKLKRGFKCDKSDFVDFPEELINRAVDKSDRFY